MHTTTVAPRSQHSSEAVRNPEERVVAPPEVELNDSAAGQANGGAKLGVGAFQISHFTTCR